MQTEDRVKQSSTPSSKPTAQWVESLVQAAAADEGPPATTSDAARAYGSQLDQLLDDAPASPPAKALDAAATQCMQAQHWRSAARLFGILAERNPQVQARHRLCANLAALQQHRPETYRTIIGAHQSSQCALTRSPQGAFTITQTLPGQQPVCLTPGMEPAPATNAAMAHLQPALARGYPVAVVGIGDGYLLDALAREPSAMAHGVTVPVYLVEPDAEVLLTCLMLHDYTGPDGPIEQGRFYWAVGAAPLEMLERVLDDEPGLYAPMRYVTQSVRAATLKGELTALGERMAQRDEALKQRIHERYENLDRAQLVARLRGEGDRPPRVLLLTSRFTTVLQHATHDAADGFAQLGWETRIVMEPGAHKRSTPRLLAEALLDFEPDMVFQIDHLRYELEGLFPPRLPFVCWIQDNVAQLACKQAGESIGTRDFVLTNSIKFYCNIFGYPQRQCIYLNKLTRRIDAPAVHAESNTDAEDVIFVSHGSGRPEDVAASIVSAIPDARGRELIHTTCRNLIAHYERDGAVQTMPELEAHFEKAEQATGVAVQDPIRRRTLLQNIYDLLNNALYRQQALRWLEPIADEMSLRVGLYGDGWEAHPRFAKWARGRVAYGPDLEALTRRARISLQLMPYACLHQRLLDGLAAGGFFLVRLYEPEMVYHRLMSFIREHVPAQACDFDSALHALDKTQRNRLRQLWREWAPLIGAPDMPPAERDPVRALRGHERAGTTFQLDLPPRLEEVGFTDASSMRRRMERFANAPEDRKRIAAAQRGFVETHYLYDTGLQRVVDRVIGLIEREPVELDAGKEVGA